MYWTRLYCRQKEEELSLSTVSVELAQVKKVNCVCVRVCVCVCVCVCALYAGNPPSNHRLPLSPSITICPLTPSPASPPPIGIRCLQDTHDRTTGTRERTKQEIEKTFKLLTLYFNFSCTYRSIILATIF